MIRSTFIRAAHLSYVNQAPRLLVIAPRQFTSIAARFDKDPPHIPEPTISEEIAHAEEDPSDPLEREKKLERLDRQKKYVKSHKENPQPSASEEVSHAEQSPHDPLKK